MICAMCYVCYVLWPWRCYVLQEKKTEPLARLDWLNHPPGLGVLGPWFICAHLRTSGLLASAVLVCLWTCSGGPGPAAAAAAQQQEERRNQEPRGRNQPGAFVFIW